MVKRQKALNRLLVGVWLIVALVCLGIVAREAYLQNWVEALKWLFMMAIASIMVWVRHSRLKKLDKEAEMQ